MGNKPELFRAYLDESEDSSSGTYVVGGFVGSPATWNSLEPKWLECLPPGITSFHATDCFTGNNQFEGVAISDRVELLEGLSKQIVAHDLWLIGYGIDANTYCKFAPKTKENEFLRNKYAAPFGGVVQLACEAMGNPPTPYNIWRILEQGEDWGECSFFIESNEYSASAKRTIESMRGCTDLWFRSRIGGETYGAKSGPAAISLLQVADFGAFLAAKHISKAPQGKIPWAPYFDSLKNSRRVYRTVIADEYSLEALHRTYEELKQERIEGREYSDGI